MRLSALMNGVTPAFFRLESAAVPLGFSGSSRFSLTSGMLRRAAVRMPRRPLPHLRPAAVKRLTFASSDASPKEPSGGLGRFLYGARYVRAGDLAQSQVRPGTRDGWNLLPGVRRLHFPGRVCVRLLPRKRIAPAWPLRPGMASGRRRLDPPTRQRSLSRSLGVHPRRQAMVQSFLALG